MIETTKILQTDLLDLLFDGRNKQYGAYELRKKYNKRMIIAVTVMIICCLLLFILYAFASGTNRSDRAPIIDEVKLAKLEPEPKPEEPLPPPPKPKLPEIKTIKFATPIITTQYVKPEDQPPPVDDFEDAKIGKVNIEGDKFTDFVAPPIDDKNNGVIELPKKPDDDDGIVRFVEIQSDYPGGLESWRRFLNKNLRYPEEAVEKEIEGTVIVQFIVDKAGLVSEVEAISGPNELRAEAVRVIKKSGLWTPAIQNGRQVKSYKQQPITFQIQQG